MHLVGCFVSFSFSLHAGAVLVVSLLFRCKNYRVATRLRFIRYLRALCIPLRVRTYYVRERNLSKEEAHGGPGTCNPRTSGTCSAKREGATRAYPEK